MTVKELIEALKDVPSHFIVETEGCDCDGDVSQVDIQPDSTFYDWKTQTHSPAPRVYLRRSGAI